MLQVGKDSLHKHVCDRLEREISDKERIQKDKSESHLYTHIRVATDADIHNYLDTGNHFDLTDFSKVGHVQISFNNPDEQYKKAQVTKK